MIENTRRICKNTMMSIIKLKNIVSLRKNHELSKWIIENEKYKNIHQGERCFILGNGPSLKQQDLSYLKDEVLFTVNQFHRADFAKDLHSSYHFWADPLFFKNNDVNSEEVQRLIKSSKGNTVSFFESAGFDYIIKNNIYKAIDCSFFKSGIPIFNEVLVDFTKPVSGCATVVQYAVEMAIFMGFNEIYILGCDMTGIITTIEAKENQELSTGYAYTLSDLEKNG